MNLQYSLMFHQVHFIFSFEFYFYIAASVAEAAAHNPSDKIKIYFQKTRNFYQWESIFTQKFLQNHLDCFIVF